MYQRLILFFLCGFFLVSCEFFQKKELSNDLVIDTVIDYNSVDVFPLFPKCDSIPSQEKQKICTQIKLSEHIYASLVSVNIITSKKVSDTLVITLNIDKMGKVSLSNIHSSVFIQQQILNLDSIIESGIKSLPLLKPAIKREMPVATEFILPIVVKN